MSGTRLTVPATVPGRLAATAVLTARPAAAAAGRRSAHTGTNTWPGGFGAPVTGPGRSFRSGRTGTPLWSGVVSRSGAAVCVCDAGYNAGIATGASVSIGFNGALTGGDTSPSALPPNGVARTGGVGTPPSTSDSRPAATPIVGHHIGAPDRHAGSQLTAINPVPAFRARYASPYVVTRDEVPNLR
ncbi:cellulose binding domain-containing protein [Actinoplanes sp. NPDC004185]